MKALMTLSNTNDIQGTLTVTMTIREWKTVRERLHKGNLADYHGTAQDFITLVQRLIAKAEGAIEAPEEITP